MMSAHNWLGRIAWVVGFVFFVGGAASAATVNVPPVVVTSLNHVRQVTSSPVQTILRDSVFIPTGGGTYSGPGFSAAIGTGDTIVVRLEAPAGQAFNITPGPGASGTYFGFYLYWHTAMSDSSSSIPTPTVTFENFQGAAMTNTYTLSYVASAGQAIVVNLQYDVNAACSFSAVQISFPVTHALASTPRTYGPVQTFSSPAISAASIYNSNYPGNPIIMALGTAGPPGACCHGALCTITLPANCTGGTAMHLGSNVACNPAVRGGTVNACCPADTDANGTVNVTDLFAYISSWFAGCP